MPYFCSHSYSYEIALPLILSVLVTSVLSHTRDSCFFVFEASLLTNQSENMAALPIVSNVQVKKLSSGNYCGEGEYFGGYEGSSLFSWYRETNDGTIILINGANSSTYEVTDSDYSCRLLFG